MSKRAPTKVVAGDRSVYPFNHAFTDQEKRVFASLEAVRITIAALRNQIRATPQHASAPPENYDPAGMEQFDAIEENLAEIEGHLRWIPGGAYRYE